MKDGDENGFRFYYDYYIRNSYFHPSLNRMEKNTDDDQNKNYRLEKEVLECLVEHNQNLNPILEENCENNKHHNDYIFLSQFEIMTDPNQEQYVDCLFLNLH